ncbi:hypothetical protein GCM10011371_29460 [Novosphingobium marinum]|uniref:Quercetin dioxygenase-like cupin family protein n=1 Tax=Novosphingobium marinum TaxID=1514948 RepID=A0A7Y9XY81_9SPHN|nr:cupin-like domain-containing protein [Novosphingobium marinum]NYH96792.1 quercetin dioxygenase-like cupin family protein [Novosphingobium marinum]GGC40203.1 hypothetical protein GCM10011371_29460 [Novosphingobium marinum]
MTDAVFTQAGLAEFGRVYPGEAARLSHRLLDHPLLTLSALEELAAALPGDSVEYNPGDLPVGIAPEDVPAPSLGIAETIRTIADNGSWMVLKRIEQHPPYAELLHALLDEVKPIVEPRTGAMLQTEGFVFVTSPGSVTPFHFDPEHNILLQVRGEKTMTVFPGDETLLRPEVHEAFHLGKHHRNIPWRDDFRHLGREISIAPGEAIHVPVKAPHFVRNGDAVSISLSVTWRSDWSFAEADARAFNHMLRQMGLSPRSPAAFPSHNRTKSLAFRAIRKARATLGLEGRAA